MDVLLIFARSFSLIRIVLHQQFRCYTYRYIHSLKVVNNGYNSLFFGHISVGSSLFTKKSERKRWFANCELGIQFDRLRMVVTTTSDISRLRWCQLTHIKSVVFRTHFAGCTVDLVVVAAIWCCSFHCSQFQWYDNNRSRAIAKK